MDKKSKDEASLPSYIPKVITAISSDTYLIQ